MNFNIVNIVIMYYETEEHFLNYKKECCEYKNSLNHDEKKWINYYCLSELKVNDIIYIEYLPNSQKYLYLHTPECGKIIEISIENEIFILNHEKKIINIEKDHLSMYSTGYDMIVKKLI